MASDFQVRVTRRTLFKASDAFLASYVLPLSNLDLLHGSFPVALLSVYPKPPAGGDFQSAVAAVEASLPAFLNHFFPFTGRIDANPRNGLPELHCNNAGAELVVGHAEVSLSDVDFGHVDKSLDRIFLPFAEDLALSVQAVGFACGSFSLSFASNHLLVDGYGLAMFPKLFTEFVKTGKLSSVPNHDRSVYRPRSPPAYGPAVGRALLRCGKEDQINVLAGDVFVRRLYHVDAADLRLLRVAASGELRATRFEAVSAYLWKALASVIGDADESCRMGWVIDGRKRLAAGAGGNSQLLSDYTGNMATLVSGEARVTDLKLSSLPRVAGLVLAAIRETANEVQVRDIIDWVELEGRETPGETRYRLEMGLGSPAVVVASFAGMGLEANFGFGLPALTSPRVPPGGRVGSALVVFVERPGGDGTWNVMARVWPRLAAALESDPARVFKPVTAEYLGLVGPAKIGPTQASRL